MQRDPLSQGSCVAWQSAILEFLRRPTGTACFIIGEIKDYPLVFNEVYGVLSRRGRESTIKDVLK